MKIQRGDTEVFKKMPPGHDQIIIFQFLHECGVHTTPNLKNLPLPSEDNQHFPSTS